MGRGKLAVQRPEKSDEERALDRLKLATQLYAFVPAFYGAFILWRMASTFWMPFSLALAPYLLGVAIYAYMNIASARAIEQRRDAHFSYFVAGMNAMIFPVGMLLSWFTWRVLSRPDVRQLYGEGYVAPPVAAKKTKADQKKDKTRLVVDSIEMPSAASFIASVDDEEERLWQEMEKRHQNQDAAAAGNDP